MGWVAATVGGVVGGPLVTHRRVGQKDDTSVDPPLKLPPLTLECVS